MWVKPSYGQNIFPDDQFFLPLFTDESIIVQCNRNVSKVAEMFAISVSNDRHCFGMVSLCHTIGLSFPMCPHCGQCFYMYTFSMKMMSVCDRVSVNSKRKKYAFSNENALVWARPQNNTGWSCVTRVTHVYDESVMCFFSRQKLKAFRLKQWFNCEAMLFFSFSTAFAR